MVINSVRELFNSEPFQPFRVRASRGAAYEVRNPGLVVVLKSQVLIVKPDSDRYSLVPFLHVAGVELFGNGRPHRRRRSRR